MIYGYIRVSSKDQNEDRQMVAMEGAGVKKENIFVDKQSGKNFERVMYQKLWRKLKVEDVLIVKSIDRLGRNYEEILEQWRLITKHKGANIVVLDMPLLDTRAKKEDLTGMFISDLVLQILSYVAETERANIRQRQAEGIAAAKKRGVHLGRPPKDIPHNFNEIRSRQVDNEISREVAASLLGVSRATYERWIHKVES